MKKLILMLMLCAPMAVFAQKFGKVNTQVVVQSLPDYAKAQGEMAALSKQKENDLKSMQDELTRKSQEYDKAKSAMNPTKQKETEEELQGLGAKIQQAYQDAQKELSEKNNALLEPILTKVQNAITAVGKAGGYTSIFEIGTSGVVFFGDNVKDVTEEVKAKIGKYSKHSFITNDRAGQSACPFFSIHKTYRYEKAAFFLSYVGAAYDFTGTDYHKVWLSQLSGGAEVHARVCCDTDQAGRPEAEV